MTLDDVGPVVTTQRYYNNRRLIMLSQLYQIFTGNTEFSGHHYVQVSRRSVKSNRKAMNRNCSNQKANPALKTKAENKKILQIDKIQ